MPEPGVFHASASVPTTVPFIVFDFCPWLLARLKMCIFLMIKESLGSLV